MDRVWVDRLKPLCCTAHENSFHASDSQAIVYLELRALEYFPYFLAPRSRCSSSPLPAPNCFSHQSLRMSRAVHLLLGTVVSLLLLGYGSALVGNCSQVEAYYVYQESVGFQIHPLRIEAFPAYNGRRAAAIGVLWEPMVVMERNRTFYDMNGALIGSPQCVYPSGLLSDPYTDDPTSACNVGTTAPCGAILQSFLFTECDCTTHTGKDIFHGVERTTYSIEYTHQLYPDMRITFHAYLVNQSVLVYPFNDPTNPDAITWDYRCVIVF